MPRQLEELSGVCYGMAVFRSQSFSTEHGSEPSAAICLSFELIPFYIWTSE